MGTAHVALAAEAVPYTDAAVTGSLGLCDIHGNPVMAGRITDKPFVWSVVGTTAAPAKYAPPIRTATLQAYQPRRGVVPGDWSGYQMGASSRYTNVLHPMAQSTPIDASLRDVLSAFPVQWEGLVQLRLFLGGSNRSPRTDHYDATDIQVTGDTWHVVRGGSGPCRAGSATSTAVLLNLPGAKGTPKAGAVASPPALAAGTTRGAASVAPGSPAGAQPTATVNAARSQPSTAVGSSQRPGTAAGSTRNLLIGGGLALALAAVLVAWAVRRRSSVVSPVDRVYSR